MKPPTAYYIQGITLITSNGKHIPLMVLEPDKIMTIPLCTVKRKLLDAFSKMVDTPVDAEFKTKSLFNN